MWIESLEYLLDVGTVLKRVGQVFCHTAGYLHRERSMKSLDSDPTESRTMRHALHAQWFKAPIPWVITQKEKVLLIFLVCIMCFWYKKLNKMKIAHRQCPKSATSLKNELLNSKYKTFLESLIFWIFLVLVFEGHTQQCSRVTPDCTLRNYSWMVSGAIWRCWGLNLGHLLARHCTISWTLYFGY